MQLPRNAGGVPVGPAGLEPAIFGLCDGFSLQEETLPFESAEEVAAIVEAFLEHFPVDEYPYLAELSVEHIMKPGYDYADEFDVGLELFLDGIDTLNSRA